MSVLNEKTNDKTRIILYVFRTVLLLSFFYKIWFMAEMQSNAFVNSFGNIMLTKIMVYIINAVTAWLMCWFATHLTYIMISRSQYCPINNNGDFILSKNDYHIIVYFAIIISNIIAGSLNFVAYTVPVSILLFVLLMPVLMAILSIVLIFTLIAIKCDKKDIKGLFVSMAMPCVIFLLLLR